MNRAPDFGRLPADDGRPRAERLLPARLLRPWPGAHRPGRQAGGRGDRRRRRALRHLRTPQHRPSPAAAAAHAGAGARHGLLPPEGSAVSPSAAIAKPVVLVPACNRMLGQHPFHIAGKKYIDAVRLAGCLPLVVPIADADELDALLDLADGVLLTGSPSNVHPQPLRRRRARPATAARPRARRLDAAADPARRSRAACRCSPSAAARRKPTWRSAAACTRRCRRCRATHDHRADDDAPRRGAVRPGAQRRRRARRRAGAHRSDRARFEVNSVHGQGVNRLADGLRVEARAPDGLVEAFSVARGAGLQPVRAVAPRVAGREQPGVDAAAQAFGAACRAYRERRDRCLARARTDEVIASAASSRRRQQHSQVTHGRQEQLHLQRARKLAQRAPRDRDRMPGARPHRRGARQDPAAREVHRRPRHAPARGGGGDGRDRRVPRRRARTTTSSARPTATCTCGPTRARCASCPGRPTRRRR